jgi:predicted nuclease with TOPRIM domain
MSTDDKYEAIKDLVLDIKSSFKEFQKEARDEIKAIKEYVNIYIQENNDRIAKLEKNDAVMNARITMYVGVGLYIITTIINFVF